MWFCHLIFTKYRKKGIKMNIYVIRHGETDMGKNKIIATESEPLNNKGMEQAINVGKELEKLDINLIYCSPIERAKHTLKLFNLDKSIPIVIEDRLKEREMGIYERVPFKDLDWEVFWSYNSEEKYNKLESMKSVYKRVNNFLNELKAKQNSKNILLVTHGGVSRAIYWYFNKIDNSLFTCENCRIYKYNI